MLEGSFMMESHENIGFFLTRIASKPAVAIFYQLTGRLYGFSQFFLQRVARSNQLFCVGTT